MECNYTTAQTPDKGVQVGPEPIPAPNAILAPTQDSIPGFGGNLIEAGIVINGNKSAVYKSKAYPANADGKQRPGATVEYSSEFSIGEGIGGIPELPWGYIRAEFFECANFQYVDTGVTVTPSTGVRFKIWQNNSSRYMVLAGNMVSPSDPGIFFPLISYKGRVGVNIRGALYLLPDGGYSSTTAGVVNGNGFMVINEKLEGKVNWLNNGQLLFKAESFTEHRSLPRTLQSGDGTIYVGTQGPIKINNYEGRIYFFDISDGSRVRMQLVPAIDPTGTPCMFDKVTRVPFYNTGWRPFIVGFTLEQALQLSKLPATGGSLTVSLPWEAQLIQYNTKVEEALQTAKNKGWTITVQYRDPEPDSTIYNKYAHCKTRADLTAVNADFTNDLTSDGEWVYPLPELTSFGAGWGEHFFSKAMVKWSVPLPKAINLNNVWAYCNNLQHLDIYAPSATQISNAGRGCGKIKYYKLYAPKATLVSVIASYNSVLQEVELDTPNVTNAEGYFFYSYGLQRVKCNADMFHNVTNGKNMYLDNRNLIEFPTSYPALSAANGMFSGCRITGQQAISILNSIPAYSSGTHEITMGIHIDYQNDAEVLAAIDAATAKGWTVMTQWTGTPTNTASTFGLKRIWVRKREAEQGEYEAQDGSRWQIEWCDMLSAPDASTPEDHGYELFQSVEVAAEQWDLISWVNSEQEEELTQEL